MKKYNLSAQPRRQYFKERAIPPLFTSPPVPEPSLSFGVPAKINLDFASISSQEWSFVHVLKRKLCHMIGVIITTIALILQDINVSN